MAAGAGEVAAGAGVTGGPTVEIVLGPSTAGAPGLELTAGGGEF